MCGREKLTYIIQNFLCHNILLLYVHERGVSSTKYSSRTIQIVPLYCHIAIISLLAVLYKCYINFTVMHCSLDFKCVQCISCNFTIACLQICISVCPILCKTSLLCIPPHCLLIHVKSILCFSVLCNTALIHHFVATAAIIGVVLSQSSLICGLFQCTAKV